MEQTIHSSWRLSSDLLRGITTTIGTCTKSFPNNAWQLSGLLQRTHGSGLPNKARQVTGTLSPPHSLHFGGTIKKPNLNNGTTMRLFTKATLASFTLVRPLQQPPRCGFCWVFITCINHTDIEYNTHCNPNTNGTALVDALLQAVDAALEVCRLLRVASHPTPPTKARYQITLQRCTVVELDSTTPSKFSRHLIIGLPNAAFVNNRHGAGHPHHLPPVCVYTPLQWGRLCSKWCAMLAQH